MAVKVTDSRFLQGKIQWEDDVFLTSWGSAKPKY